MINKITKTSVINESKNPEVKPKAINELIKEDYRKEEKEKQGNYSLALSNNIHHINAMEEYNKKYLGNNQKIQRQILALKNVIKNAV